MAAISLKQASNGHMSTGQILPPQTSPPHPLTPHITTPHAWPPHALAPHPPSALHIWLPHAPPNILDSSNAESCFSEKPLSITVKGLPSLVSFNFFILVEF